MDMTRRVASYWGRLEFSRALRARRVLRCRYPTMTVKPSGVTAWSIAHRLGVLAGLENKKRLSGALEKAFLLSHKSSRSSFGASKALKGVGRSKGPQNQDVAYLTGFFWQQVTSHGKGPVLGFWGLRGGWATGGAAAVGGRETARGPEGAPWLWRSLASPWPA
jgi:hypothetical protein